MMLDELWAEIEEALASVRDELKVLGGLPQRKQRALLKQLAAMREAWSRGEEFATSIRLQARVLALQQFWRDAQELAARPPAPASKRLPRGRHLRSV